MPPSLIADGVSKSHSPSEREHIDAPITQFAGVAANSRAISTKVRAHCRNRSSHLRNLTSNYSMSVIQLCNCGVNRTGQETLDR